MTNIEMLPLPNSGSGFYEDNVWHDTFSKRQMEAYARANKEPLITENERLRAEVERLQSINSGLCRKSNYYLIDSARWQERVEKLEEALRKVGSLLGELEIYSTHDSIIVDECWQVIEEALPDSFVV